MRRQILHRDRDPRIARSMTAGVILMALTVGGTLGVLAVKVHQVRLSYRLDALRTARVGLEDLERQLSVEVATLRAPARIERSARALGLTRPSPEQVRLAREYVPGTATSSAAMAQDGERGSQVRVR